MAPFQVIQTPNPIPRQAITPSATNVDLALLS
jgi:hypothetical protein